MALGDIYSAIHTRWICDTKLTSLVSGGLFLGQVPPGTPAPSAAIRQSPGGQICRTTGRACTQTYALRFDAQASSFDAAEQIALAILRRFEGFSFSVGTQPIVAMEPTAPPFIEQTSLDTWCVTIHYQVTINAKSDV